MKFTNGNWLVRKEYNIFGAVEVNDYEISGNSVILYVPTFHVNSRGDTLGGPLLTIEISSPMEDVISVKLYHFKGKANKSPKFEINRKDDVEVDIKEDNSHITFTSGNLTAKIKTKGDWSIDFFIGHKRITGTGFKNMAYITSQNGETYVREQLDLGVDEYVYGLGERFTPYVKNGQAVDIWNRDGGTSSEQAYKNIPWDGDCTATYESMAESLRGGLSLSMSGFAFWSHDIAGFESTTTPDIYKRWTAFGLLSSQQTARQWSIQSAMAI